MFRSQTARYKRGLYATRGFMLPGESVEEFIELQTQLRAYRDGRQLELLEKK